MEENIDPAEIAGIKTGTDSNLINGVANKKVIRKIADGIIKIKKVRSKDNNKFYPFIIFSGSGSYGAEELGLEEKPKNILDLKVCASVGQNSLTTSYATIFKKKGLITAQFLFTYRDLTNARSAKKLKQTLYRCFSLGIIPLINFNDPLDDAEVSADNDRFAAVIMNLLDGKVLIILTDKVDGFQNTDGKLIPEIIIEKDEEIEELKKFCFQKISQNSTGGMETKLEAVKQKKGGVVIFGNAKSNIKKLLEGKCVCTVFRKK